MRRHSVGCAARGRGSRRAAHPGTGCGGRAARPARGWRGVGARRRVGCVGWSLARQQQLGGGRRAQRARRRTARRRHAPRSHVPNIWYRASIVVAAGGTTRRMSGITLPGTPAVVVGSNGDLAWAYTNSEVDTSDLVVLETDAASGTYRTPDGRGLSNDTRRSSACAALPTTRSSSSRRSGVRCSTPTIAAGGAPFVGSRTSQTR